MATVLPGSVPASTVPPGAGAPRTLSFGGLRTDAYSIDRKKLGGGTEDEKIMRGMESLQRKQRGAKALKAVLFGPTVMNWLSACYATWIGELFTYDSTGVEHNMQMAQTYNYMSIFFIMCGVSINTIFVRESSPLNVRAERSANAGPAFQTFG